MLEQTSLDAIDTVGSYFALKWHYQMSLSSKLSQKKVHRHPNFLIYYSFQLDSSWTRQLRLIGMQASTYGGLERWIGNSGQPRELGDREIY